MVQIDEKVYGASSAKLASIFDAGTFVEIGAYVKRCGSTDAYDGVICGYGSIGEKLAFAFVQDSDRSKGAFDEATAEAKFSAWKADKQKGLDAFKVKNAAEKKAADEARLAAEKKTNEEIAKKVAEKKAAEAAAKAEAEAAANAEATEGETETPAEA
mgnify:CR=1 FL=1